MTPSLSARLREHVRRFQVAERKLAALPDDMDIDPLQYESELAAEVPELDAEIKLFPDAEQTAALVGARAALRMGVNLSGQSNTEYCSALLAAAIFIERQISNNQDLVAVAATSSKQEDSTAALVPEKKEPLAHDPLEGERFKKDAAKPRATVSKGAQSNVPKCPDSIGDAFHLAMLEKLRTAAANVPISRKFFGKIDGDDSAKSRWLSSMAAQGFLKHNGRSGQGSAYLKSMDF